MIVAEHLKDVSFYKLIFSGIFLASRSS